MGVALNSYQRRLCHGIAAECGLGHESRGDGNQGQIYCWRLSAEEPPAASDTDDAPMEISGTAAREEQSRAAGMVAEAFVNALRATMEEAEKQVRAISNQRFGSRFESTIDHRWLICGG